MPECKQEVSSAAPACPHCGYPLQKKAAPLGEIQRHRTIGMVFLALGFAAVFGGLILAFTWSLLSILGALLIIGGSALMSMGYLQTTGFYNVSCPQCGAQGTRLLRAPGYGNARNANAEAFGKAMLWKKNEAT